jgi:hypothetical protein
MKEKNLLAGRLYSGSGDRSSIWSWPVLSSVRSLSSRASELPGRSGQIGITTASGCCGCWMRGSHREDGFARRSEPWARLEIRIARAFVPCLATIQGKSVFEFGCCPSITTEAERPSTDRSASQNAVQC